MRKAFSVLAFAVLIFGTSANFDSVLAQTGPRLKVNGQVVIDGSGKITKSDVEISGDAGDTNIIDTSGLADGVGILIRYCEKGTTTQVGGDVILSRTDGTEEVVVPDPSGLPPHGCYDTKFIHIWLASGPPANPTMTDIGTTTIF